MHTVLNEWWSQANMKICNFLLAKFSPSDSTVCYALFCKINGHYKYYICDKTKYFFSICHVHEWKISISHTSSIW